jgi:flagellar biosynthetic protein FliP
MDSAQTIQQIIESDGFQGLSPQVKVALFLGGMALISAALVTMTAFTRIVIVLSFVRRALSTQEIPPTQVILGLVPVSHVVCDGTNTDQYRGRCSTTVPRRHH